jgi:hypothetical protein
LFTATVRRYGPPATATTWAAPSPTPWANIFDGSAAEADLGFQYTILWHEGVRRIVAWLDERNRITGDDEPAFYQSLLDAWQEAATGTVDKMAELRRG